jgi:eukaryotic-like serine/threonine-protein kinase
VTAGHFDAERTAALFAKAFRAAGLDVEGLSVEEAAEQIRRTTVAAELAAALDYWAIFCPEKRNPTRQHLLAVARAADPAGAAARVRDVLLKGDRQVLVALAASEEAHDLLPPTVRALATRLESVGAGESAITLLRAAQRRHPDDFWLNETLGWVLARSQPPLLEESIRYCTAAVSLRPNSPGAHLNLGEYLRQKGQLDDAIAEFREALRLKKDYFEAHNNLGLALHAKGRLDEAIAEYREAIRLKKGDAEAAAAHCNLGLALRAKGQMDGAIAEYREAIRLKKDYPEAHNNLGVALTRPLQFRGRFEEPVTEPRAGE